MVTKDCVNIYHSFESKIYFPEFLRMRARQLLFKSFSCAVFNFSDLVIIFRVILLSASLNIITLPYTIEACNDFSYTSLNIRVV